MIGPAKVPFLKSGEHFAANWLKVNGTPLLKCYLGITDLFAMETLTQLLDQLLFYIEIGVEIALQYLLTVEGIIAVLFLTFLAGFISRIRSI